MNIILGNKLMYRMLLLSGLLLCLWAVSTGRKNAPQTDTFIPVVITEQLQPKDGVIPVHVRCGAARLSAPNRLEEFQCSFKNNTNLSITAASAICSIVLEQNGSLTRDTFSRNADTLLHPDFRTTSKRIGPGDESDLGLPGPISYANGAIVKGVEISLDFVEFENGATLGRDQQGSRVIRAMRAGAGKYREWLKRRYKLAGGSVAAVSSDIESDQSLPGELRFADANEEQGAKGYQSLLRRLLKNSGATGVKELLDSN